MPFVVHKCFLVFAFFIWSIQNRCRHCKRSYARNWMSDVKRLLTSYLKYIIHLDLTYQKNRDKIDVRSLCLRWLSFDDCFLCSNISKG
jgi:hypothetical protein